MDALKISPDGTVNVERVEIPALRPGYLLVRIVCVGLNPFDAKSAFDENPPITSLGADYSGVVEKTGTGYIKDWQKGDRICGAIFGANILHPTDGAFAGYAVVKADVQYRMPDDMSFVAAASLGVALGTAAMGICHKLRIGPILTADDIDDGAVKQQQQQQQVLVYGGSTATGTMSIQLAHLAGWKVITTCSPRNFDLVNSYGADGAFDYKDARCSAKIFGFAGGGVSRAYDCISTNDSAAICSDAMGGGSELLYSHVLPLSESFKKRKVLPKLILFWTAFGEEVQMMGHQVPAFSEDFEFLSEFVDTVEQLLEEGELKTHPVREMEGGLASVGEGLRMLYNGQVSAEKLVYEIGTP